MFFNRNMMRTMPIRVIDFDDEDESVIAEEDEASKRKKNPGINLSAPDHYDGVDQIAGVIENEDNAVINMRKLNETDRRRVTDFLSGLTYHREYELIFISEELIVCRVQ